MARPIQIVPSVLPAAPAGRGLTPSQKRRRAVGRALASDGYVEVLAPVFLPAHVFDTWGLDADDPRRHTTKVLNPLESDRPELATTLLPGMLEVLSRNVSRGQRDVSLYGVAQVVLVGTWANLCVEWYLRGLLARGFDVAVVGNATAAAIASALSSAHQAA